MMRRSEFCAHIDEICKGTAGRQEAADNRDNGKEKGKSKLIKKRSFMKVKRSLSCRETSAEDEKI